MNQSTALKRLNKLIKTLPEYKAIADALPNNVTIQELTLVEHATKKNTSCKHVSYQGLNPTKGKNTVQNGKGTVTIMVTSNAWEERVRTSKIEDAVENDRKRYEKALE